MAEVGLLSFPRGAMETASVVPPLYRRRYRKHQFTQVLWLAILCFRRYEDGTFREAEVRLAEPRELPGALGLSSVPDYTTLYRFLQRLGDGTPNEAILSLAEAAAFAGQVVTAQPLVQPADAEKLRLLVESARIRLAYAYDRQFAVSLSGTRTLPHLIEAVYMKMLPQPRLRFLLADDPGAGKTIMAGLLLKEMKLREAIERILIFCPAPLTIQWQDELPRWSGEPFEVIFSAVDQHQLVNPWQRATQVIVSLDYAKQEDIRERVWQQRWDLVIVDEAHRCSAYTKRSSRRGDEVEKTRRYQLAERLAADADNTTMRTVLLSSLPARCSSKPIRLVLSHPPSSRPLHWAPLRDNSCARQLRGFCCCGSSQQIS